MAFPGSNSLSRMSGNQTSELKELESSYEKVLDENCRVFSEYFIEVLENKDGGRVINPPTVVFKLAERVEEFKYGGDDRRIEPDEPGFENGRYNVMNSFLSIILLKL